ncbi:hypothetical protein HPP92_028276 [Vanilla planifolia]|uniref:Uncharacterized protein n=1 Tax=Vanilla planifolia TaxID=51239 RepID=A0A835P820_VANPL|nr:hypothetical protein HPP92_028276 [Vanilla planifolia]
MASWNAVWRLMSLFLPQEQSGCILTTGSLFIVHVGECIEEIADRKELLHSGACPYSPLGTWWRDREGNQRQQNGGHDQQFDNNIQKDPRDHFKGCEVAWKTTDMPISSIQETLQQKNHLK